MGIYFCGSFTQELRIKNEDAMVLLIAWYFLCYVPIFKASRMLVEKQCSARGLYFSLPRKENKGRINCDTLSDFLPHIIIYTTLYFHQEALIYAPQFSSNITVLPFSWDQIVFTAYKRVILFLHTIIASSRGKLHSTSMSVLRSLWALQAT